MILKIKRLDFLNSIFIALFFLSFSLKLSAQPVDSDLIINEAAYTEAFLHCTIDEKYFAKYAVEARSPLMEMKDNIFCKLHVPIGLRNSCSEFLKNRNELKAEFDYFDESNIPIIFNFYFNGVKVSSAKHYFDKDIADAPFTYIFTLNPDDFSKKDSEINFAYLQLLTNIKYAYSTIYIEASIAPKNLESKNYIRLATGTFSMRLDPKKQEELKNKMNK